MSGTCSSAGRRPLPAARFRVAGSGKRVALALLLAFAGAAVPAAEAQQLTQDEALRLAFPGATAVERKTAFLGAAQVAAAKRLAGSGVEVRAGVVTYYAARRGATPLGVAYFDSHRVRTLPEVVMIVVTPQATIERIEVLRFSEPPQYRAPDGWLDQLEGEGLTARLSLRGSVANMTGATLTSKALTDAARRTLALHRVIHGAPPATAR